MSDQPISVDEMDEHPFIFVAQGSTVYQKSLRSQELWDFAREAFRISHPIRAMSVHVKWNMVYLLDDQGSIWTNTTKVNVEVDGTIMDVKVDWLFDFLVVITDQNEVHKCSLSKSTAHTKVILSLSNLALCSRHLEVQSISQ